MTTVVVVLFFVRIVRENLSEALLFKKIATVDKNSGFEAFPLSKRL